MDTSTISQTLITPDFQLGNLRHFDFNGDGRQDLAYQDYYCAYYYLGACEAYINEIDELISNGDGTFSSVRISVAENGPDSINIIFANVNSDACTDAVSGQSIYISACNGSNGAALTSTYPIVSVMDWNGDGLGDLIENNGGTLYTQLSTATGFGTAAATSVPYATNCFYIAFDADGDGLDELGCMSTLSGTAGFVYYLHNGSGQPPDLMASITDGYGNFAKPVYVSMVRGANAIYFPWNDATYPYTSYLAPLYLVANTTFSDPSNPGSTYLIWDYYAGAWMSLQGRGFAGFGNYQTYDTRNSVYETFGYGRAFPYTGMLTSDVATLSNYSSQMIFNVSRATSLTTLDGTAYNQRYFPYVSSETRNDYEVGGPKAWQLITTTATSYAFDDYGNATSISRTVTDEDSSSPYYTQSWTTTATDTPDPDTSTWCLNLLTESQVAYTSTLSGSASVTRTRSFTPDTSNCRYTQIVTEPSSASYKVSESLAYDSFGNVNSDTVTGVNMTARQTMASWGTTGQLPASITDPTNATTRFGYDWRFGLPSSVTDANQLNTSWSYNEFGRKVQENRPDGTYTQWGYYNCVNWGGCLLGTNTLAITHNVYGVGGTLIQNGTDRYDMLERPVLSGDLLLSGNWDRREVRYDSLGRIVKRAAPCSWVDVPTTCPYWTTASYDLLNRVTQVQRPVSSTNSNLQTTTYTYEGRATVVTDPQNNTRTTVIDVNGWLRQAEDAYGYIVTLAYDSAGSKTSAKDSLGNTLWTGGYAYGLSAFLTSETDMDRGSWAYTVDALGERTGWTDAKGQSFGESYDALSRPSSRSEPDLFTQWTWGSTPASHNVGKLASVCTGTGTNPTNCTSAPGYSETETYDSVGRLYQRALTLPSAGTFTYTRQYESTTGLLSSLTYPTSTNGCQVVVSYGYTNAILSSVTDASNQAQCGSTGTVFWQANAQNPARQITEETLGNGIVTNRTYDAVTHWLGSLQAGVGGGAGVKNLSFLYDELGNVTLRQDNNLSLNENIYYDKDYRLSYTTLGSTQNLSISYDAMGNITSRSDVAQGATWTYDPVRKHAVTEAGNSSYTYSYDANGNMSSRMGSTISWSSFNYPTAISAGSGSTAETVSFAYGPDRQRYQQNYSGNSNYETTYYLGEMLDVVTSGGVTDYRHYIYAGDEPVAVYSRKSSGSNAVSYVLSDHEGSVAALTNSSGGTVVSESFTPYGNRRNPITWSGAASDSDLTTASGITRQAYTFQTQLGHWMGMNHMNGRVQDSIIGRFLSADPDIPDPADPQSYNRYSYVRNNPLTLTDPSGFFDNGQEGGEFIYNNGESGQYSAPAPGFVPGTICSYIGCWFHEQLCAGGSCQDQWGDFLPTNFNSLTPYVPQSTPNNAANTSGDGGGVGGASFPGASQGHQQRERQIAPLKFRLPQTKPPLPDKPKTCSAAPDVTGKVGLFGDIGVGKLTASLNLFSWNFPTQGGMYMSQGAGVGLRGTSLFGIPLSLGFDRSSFNGGLSWQTTSWQASSDRFGVSTDEGVSFEVGLLVGVSFTHLENLLNLLVPCAQ